MHIVALMQWLVQYSIVPMLLVFILVVVSTYLPGRKREMERNARIPFDDER